MKLILAVIRDSDESPVINKLVEQGYRVTRMASTGGFLRKGNVTLLIGVDEEQVQAVFDLMRDTCGPPEASQHRATLFVLNTKHFEQV
jgi:uncharacterized protein YaaQ